MNRRGSPARSPPGSSATPRASCRWDASPGVSASARAPAPKRGGPGERGRVHAGPGGMRPSRTRSFTARRVRVVTKASKPRRRSKTDRAPTPVLARRAPLETTPRRSRRSSREATLVAGRCPGGARLRLALIGTEAEATAAAANGANGASVRRGVPTSPASAPRRSTATARGRARRRARTRCWRGRTGTSRGSGRGGGDGGRRTRVASRAGRDAPT